MTSTMTRKRFLAALLAVAAIQLDPNAVFASSRTKPDMAGHTGEAAPQDAIAAPRAAKSSQLLPNGDFEQGQTAWTEYSLNDFDIILREDDPVDPPPFVPFSGAWLAWLGGFDEETSYIEQRVSLPVAVGNLTFQLLIDSIDLCGVYYDVAEVRINNTVVKDYDLCEGNNTTGWRQEQLDLTAYAGQTVTIRFWVETDDLLYSSFFVDDVGFDATDLIFADGFESGDVSAWSGSTQ
jgi:hypothetical protein